MGFVRIFLNLIMLYLGTFYLTLFCLYIIDCNSVVVNVFCVSLSVYEPLLSIFLFICFFYSITVPILYLPICSLRRESRCGVEWMGLWRASWKRGGKGNWELNILYEKNLFFIKTKALSREQLLMKLLLRSQCFDRDLTFSKANGICS